MILLLGGAAGVGKTTLALEVAHRLGIGRVLSTDSIRQIMRLMLSADLVPAIHGSSYDAYTHFPPGALGADPLLEGFRAQAATVAVGVRASIERAIDENASTVIDGVALFPGALDLALYKERADVIFLVVAALDRDSWAARFSAREAGESQRPAHEYLANLDKILRIQDQFLEAAERYGIPIVVNDRFDRAVLLVLRHLTESLGKRPDFDPRTLLVSGSRFVGRIVGDLARRSCRCPSRRMPTTLGALRASGYRARSVREELRENLLAKMRERRADLLGRDRLRGHRRARGRERDPVRARPDLPGRARAGEDAHDPPAHRAARRVDAGGRGQRDPRRPDRAGVGVRARARAPSAATRRRWRGSTATIATSRSSRRPTSRSPI